MGKSSVACHAVVVGKLCSAGVSLGWAEIDLLLPSTAGGRFSLAAWPGHDTIYGRLGSHWAAGHDGSDLVGRW